MEGQAFFTTIAGLAISLAGFGAVIAWLRDDPSGWDVINLWRVKTIVRHALLIAFICLSLVPIYNFVQDDTATIRIGSAVVALLSFGEMWRFRHPDPAIWTPRGSWLVFMSLNSLIGLVALINVAWGSLALLQTLVLVVLTSPAGIFSNFVRELGGQSKSVEDDDLSG